ncbi:MAG: MarR family transcriptional regulator [Alcanivorax sp.]|jgi:DNA-binding MarR family transcriptional regulator|nr:MarR family transcriptional regulator [Alcanivorax sp.]|tara:strand:+ start:582 stop:1031 length:450 start_codon:yes stop_codon:yes gene_type:complete
MKTTPQQNTITAWARLLRTQGQWQAEVHQALKTADLPPLAWYDVLLELHRVGDAGLRQYQIGEQTLLTKHNLSRLLDRLENEALVTRRECAEDGRGNVVLITAAGRRLLKKMWPVYGRVIRERLEDRLTEQEIATLATLLGKLEQGTGA